MGRIAKTITSHSLVNCDMKIVDYSPGVGRVWSVKTMRGEGVAAAPFRGSSWTPLGDDVTSKSQAGRRRRRLRRQ